MVRDKEISEYNIAQARTSFIISPTKPSYRDLAKSYGVSKSALQSISVQEDWEAQRIEYQNQVITKAQNSFKAKVAKERAKKLKKINTIFEKGAVYDPEILYLSAFCQQKNTAQIKRYSLVSKAAFYCSQQCFSYCNTSGFRPLYLQLCL